MTKHMTILADERSEASAMLALSPLEWKVVSLALREAGNRPCSAGRKPSAIARIWQALTGTNSVRPLADPRLEALRRFVCSARGNGRGSDAAAKALAELGFNPNQISAVAMLSAR